MKHKPKTRSAYHKGNIQELKDLIIEALEESLGIITTACKAVDITRDTFYKIYREDEEFAKRVDDVSEFTMDFVESKLLKAIRSEDKEMIRFYMKTKGKKRGYGPNMDITTNGNNISNVTVDIIYTKKEDDKNDGES